MCWSASKTPPRPVTSTTSWCSSPTTKTTRGSRSTSAAASCRRSRSRRSRCCLGDVTQGQQISKKIIVRGKKPFKIVSFQCNDEDSLPIQDRRSIERSPHRRNHVQRQEERRQRERSDPHRDRLGRQAPSQPDRLRHDCPRHAPATAAITPAATSATSTTGAAGTAGAASTKGNTPGSVARQE